MGRGVEPLPHTLFNYQLREVYLSILIIYKSLFDTGPICGNIMWLHILLISVFDFALVSSEMYSVTAGNLSGMPHTLPTMWCSIHNWPQLSPDLLPINIYTATNDIGSSEGKYFATHRNLQVCLSNQCDTPAKSKHLVFLAAVNLAFLIIGSASHCTAHIFE